MAFVPTKCHSDSLQGKSPVKAKFDHTTVPLEQSVHMRVPEDAMVDDTTLDDDTMDADVVKTLNTVSNLVHFASQLYHSDNDSCLRAIDVLATYILPAIFPDDQHDLQEHYKTTLHRNPWLIKMLFNACKAEKYHDIRRIGLCGGRLSALWLILPADLRRRPPLAAPKGAKVGWSAAEIH